MVNNQIEIKEIYDGMEILHKPTGGVIRFSIVKPVAVDTVPILRIYLDGVKFFENEYFNYYKTYEGIKNLANIIEKRVLCTIDKSVVQHLLQRHVMLQWLEFHVKEDDGLFLLTWNVRSNNLTRSIQETFNKEFPKLIDCTKYYNNYIIGLIIKNENEFLPEHFETTFTHGKWLHLSRKNCSVHEIRDEYIYYNRKFLLSVAGVEGK